MDFLQDIASALLRLLVIGTFLGFATIAVHGSMFLLARCQRDRRFRYYLEAFVFLLAIMIISVYDINVIGIAIGGTKYDNWLVIFVTGYLPTTLITLGMSGIVVRTLTVVGLYDSRPREVREHEARFPDRNQKPS